MFRLIHIFVFIVITIFVCGTFGAKWFEDPDIIEFAPSYRTMNCELWITSSGFTATNVALNWDRAQSRNKSEDSTKFYLAVIYAQVLVAFPNTVTNPEGPLTPKDFCEQRGHFENNFLEFIEFGNVWKSCHEWLVLYGYSTYEKQTWNYYVAQPRNPEEDGSISFFATLYAWFITSDTKYNNVPVDKFCNGIFGSGWNTQFMKLSDQIFNCQAWIVHYGFHINDVPRNIQKVNDEKNEFPIFENFINKNARDYFNELLQLLGKKRSKSSVMAAENAEYEHLKVKKFCKDRGYHEDRRVRYFE